MRIVFSINTCVLCAFMISCLLTKCVESLLFSQFTLMQVVFAVSWPIPYKNPLRKLFFNIGFQFNYMEPFRLSSFYNATYFQNPFTNRGFKSNVLDPKTQENNIETTTIDSATPAISKSIVAGNETNKGVKSMNTRSSDQLSPIEQTNTESLIGKDLTAAELYAGIEEHLSNGGFHRICLLKSICELARHPLHLDEEEHLLAEVITFLLTPSQHKGFALHEKYERQKYEAAERIGEQGGDCHQIYSECENSFLEQMSYVSATMHFM